MNHLATEMEEVIIIVVIVTASSGESKKAAAEAQIYLLSRHVLSSLLFSVMCSFPFHLICVMLMLLPFKQHLLILYPQSPNIHPHFPKKRLYTRLISNGEQTLSRNYFYFIFYSFFTPSSSIFSSSIPSQLFLLYYFSQTYKTQKKNPSNSIHEKKGEKKEAISMLDSSYTALLFFLSVCLGI